MKAEKPSDLFTDRAYAFGKDAVRRLMDTGLEPEEMMAALAYASAVICKGAKETGMEDAPAAMAELIKAVFSVLDKKIRADEADR